METTVWETFHHNVDNKTFAPTTKELPDLNSYIIVLETITAEKVRELASATPENVKRK